MTEGFRKRMAALVGDDNSVARYLTEKIGHTALIAWTLVCLGPQMRYLTAAVVAAVVYVGAGKLRWWIRYRAFDPVDAAFDLVVCLAVAIPPAWDHQSPAFAVVAAVAWVAVVVVGSNNQWGKPS